MAADSLGPQVQFSADQYNVQVGRNKLMERYNRLRALGM